jgi:hypothetical protein
MAQMRAALDPINAYKKARLKAGLFLVLTATIA